MKKFMKRCGIAALILIIVGGSIATVASLILGTDQISWQVYDVTNGKVNIRLGGENWGIILGGSDVTMTGDAEIFTGKVEKKNLGSEVSALCIDVGGAKLVARESGDDSFYVEADVTGKLQAYVENGKLNIIFRNEKNSTNKEEIQLYIPADYALGNIAISLGAGELHLGNIAGENIEIELGAGEIEVDALTGDTCTISVGMGEIEVDDMSVDRLEASVGMGACAISGRIRREAALDCSMGEINLRLEGSEQDYNYQVDASMGNVAIGSSTHSGFAMEQTIDNHADTDITVDCSMGDVTILFAKE